MAGVLPFRVPEHDEHPAVVLMLTDGYDLDGLRRAHTDDGRGYCRTCGGPQSGRDRWPCRIADRAVTVRAGRERDRRRARMIPVGRARRRAAKAALHGAADAG